MTGNHIVLLRQSETGDFLPLAEVISLTPPSLSRDTFELHEMNARSKTFLPGLKDAGEMSAEVNFFDPELVAGENWGSSPHSPVYADFRDGRIVSYVFRFPDGTNWLCPCIVTSFAVNTPAGDRVTASITLKLAGAPKFGYEPAFPLQAFAYGPPEAFVEIFGIKNETDGTPVTIFTEN